MYVHAALIKRMPAELDFFDYEIPVTDHARIAIGSLIEVPFRSRTEYAVVMGISKKSHISTNSVRTISAVKNEIPLLSESHVALLQQIACESFTSLSTVLKTFLPKLLVHVSWKKLPKKNSGTPSPEHTLYVFNKITALIHALLQQAKKMPEKKQALLLVPDIQSAQFLFSLLQTTGNAWDLFDSTLPYKAKTALWQRIRNGEACCLIGTRSALFLPFTNLSQLLIYREDDVAYQFVEQHPDLDAIRLAHLVANTYNATISSFTVTPRVEMYGRYAKKIVSEKNTPQTVIQLIDKKQFFEKKQQSLISQDLIEFIDAHKKPVAILYNRKGYAKQRRCRDCGWEPICASCHTAEFLKWQTASIGICLRCGKETPPPESCPSCGGVRLTILSPGLLRLSQLLQSALPHKTIVQIEKNTPAQVNTIPDIYLATSFATSNIPWESLGAAIILDADMQLSFPDFRTEERFLQRIRWIAARLPIKALCAVVTNDPNRPVMQALASRTWSKWIDAELVERKTYTLPPYATLGIIKSPKKNTLLTLEEIEKNMSKLRTTYALPLTSLPIMYRAKESLLIRIPSTASPALFQEIKKVSAPYTCMPLPLDVNN